MLAALIIIFWFTKIVEVSVRRFNFSISAKGTLYAMLREPSVWPGWTICTMEPSGLGVFETIVGVLGLRGAGGV